MQLAQAPASRYDLGVGAHAKDYQSLDESPLLVSRDLSVQEDLSAQALCVRHPRPPPMASISCRTWAVSSKLAVANKRPSGLNATSHTGPPWADSNSCRP